MYEYNFITINMYCIRKDDCLNYYYLNDKCRECQKHCPEKAIIVKHDGRTWMNRNKCVQCGLCQDACPEDAIYDDGWFWCHDMWIRY